MSVLDEGNSLGVVEVLEDTVEYNDFLRACGNLEEIEGTEEIFYTTPTLDKDMVSSIENKFPGLILDNVRYSERYTEEGHSAGLENIQRRKEVAVSDMATAFVGVVDKLQTLTSKLKDSTIKGSLSTTLNTLQRHAVGLEMDKVKLNDAKLLIAYNAMMGVEADSVQQVKELITKISTYKNPIQCLKDFPNSKYDKIFTPLLADSAADNSRVFKAFSAMNEEYASELVSTVRQTQHDLNNIVNAGDWQRLSRFTDNLIPKNIDQVLNDLVSSLEIEVSSSKSLLSQTAKIGSQLSKQLRTNDVSLNKKAVVLNAITHRSALLDKGFKDITEITNTLASLNQDDTKVLSDVREGLKRLRSDRTKKQKASQLLTPVGRQASAQYRRLMGEIHNLWNLVNLFTQISVVYVSCYSILKITLDNFSTRFLAFSRAVQVLKLTDETK